MTKLDLISQILMLGFKLRPNCVATYGLNNTKIYISNITRLIKIYSDSKIVYVTRNKQYEKVWSKLIKILQKED